MSSESEEDDFLGFPQTQGSKRILSTEDPDYSRPPNPKRIKEMEERAQDELRERVIKVVDTVLCSAINEKQSEMEEVDSRILRVQQCLHTLRYCISLNYHAVNKLSSRGSIEKQNYEAHPAVRKHMGKSPISHSLPSTSKLSNSTVSSTAGSSDVINRVSHILCDTHLDVGKNNKGLKDSVPYVDVNIHKSFISTCELDTNQHENFADICENSSKNLKSSRPPSPKYLPPKPPDTHVIAQGRHQRFQTKRRLVVGNTYQYLTPQAGREAEDAMRYKWQIYVRAPPQETNIASFVSDVTFILDRSYAPHDVINLTQPPFILSRRGWGEFKVQIVLKFHDGRNKTIQLLHPLVLSRPDDPLALTGLWRLGQENWYDIWVYERSSSQTTGTLATEETKAEEDVPASLESELHFGTISSQIDQNITVCHREQLKEIPSVRQGDSSNTLGDKEEDASSVHKPISDHCKVAGTDILCMVRKPDSQKGIKINDDISEVGTCTSKLESGTFEDSVKVLNSGSADGIVAGNNGTQSKMCKIHVRQPDGRLVPYFIPAHMYSVALKIAQMKSTASKKGKCNKTENQGANVSSDEQARGSNCVDSNSKTSLLTIVKDMNTKQITGVPISSDYKAKSKDLSLLSKMVIKNEVNSSLTNKKVIIPIKPKDDNVITSSGIPVKILNISPLKNTVKPGTVVSASAVGSDNVQKLANTSQGKQTVVRSGTLTQSGLMQFLAKAGVKEKNVIVQQLLSKSGIKEGVSDTASPQTIQGQLLTSQNTLGSKANIHLMPLKIIQDKSKAKLNDKQILLTSASRIIQQPINPANIKFVTNNGQVIYTNSMNKGVVLNTSSLKPNSIIKSVPVSSTLVALTTASTSEGTSIDKSNIFMTSDGNILTTSAGLQVVTSQEKSIVSQHTPLVIGASGDRGRVLQVPSIIVRDLSTSGCESQSQPASSTTATTYSSASGNLMVTGLRVLPPRESKVTPNAEIFIKPKTSTASGIATALPLATNIQNKSINALSVQKSFTINVAEPDMLTCHQPSKITEDALQEQAKWEDWTKDLAIICEHCSSTEACVSLWVRALPLISGGAASPIKAMFPYRANSRDQFLKWPLGKQRAAEFQRGREVKRWLEICNVEGREQWSLTQIVGWARRYAHTPLPYRKILRTDNVNATDIHDSKKTTLSLVKNLDKLKEENNGIKLLSPNKDTKEIDVITVDDFKYKEKSSLSSQKNQMEILPLEDPDLVCGCEWVGRRASEIKVNLPMEEFQPGIVVDVTKAVAWKAVLSFMEDLLRASHSQAWQENSNHVVVPPKTISFKHVKAALSFTRPEFDLFTCDGLGTVAELVE